MSPDELDEAMGSGDPDRVVAVLVGATEAERLAAADVPGLWNPRIEEHWKSVRSGGDPLIRQEVLENFGESLHLAVLGTTSNRPELYHAYNVNAWRASQVLAERRPPWVAGWVLEAFGRLPGCWALLRFLEQAGLVERPDTEQYVLGLISAGHARGPNGMLLEDPDILANEIWLIFEYEGSRDASLALLDRYRPGETGWTATLLRLSEEGRLSRARLLDASLDALARDFAQYRAGWFSRFHEALSPTLEERAARLDRYLALLSSRIPPTVSFAVKSLGVLDKRGKLPAGPLLEHAAAALAAREKATVTQTLKLIGRACKREPAAAALAAVVAAEALLHEAAEIQAAALELIEASGAAGDPRVRSALEERQGDIAASQRTRILALLGSAPQAAAAADGGETVDLLLRAERLSPRWRELAGIRAAVDSVREQAPLPPALALRFHQVPRLDPAAAIQPIETLDELIDVFSVLLESFEPAEEIERMLDGLSRLCAERPEDFDRRTGPLRKRATKLFSRAEWATTFCGVLSQDCSALALVWTTGELVPARPQDEPGLDSFSGLRVLEIARRVASREPRALLAMPTHRGGWIDPLILLERVRAAREWDLADAVQAMLRIAPDRRTTALKSAGDLPGELGQAVRHALGGEEMIGPAAPLWVAAARARSPREDDPAVENRHPERGPDAGRAVRLAVHIGHETHEYDGETYHYYPVKVEPDPVLPDALNPALPTVLQHTTSGAGQAERGWCAMVWPAGRHAWFGRGVALLGNNLPWSEAEWGNRVFLEALLDPDTPLCEMGRLLLGIGLATKEPGEVGLSVDALIAAVQDGRIDSKGLGGALATLGATRLPKGARWAKTLGEAARATPLHREVIRDALELLLGAGPDQRPADLLALLTLFQELCVETAAAPAGERARAFLAGVKGGKSGAAAKALLGLAEGDRTGHRRAAAVVALEGRVERAERWQQMTAQPSSTL